MKNLVLNVDKHKHAEIGPHTRHHLLLRRGRPTHQLPPTPAKTTRQDTPTPAHTVESPRPTHQDPHHPPVAYTRLAPVLDCMSNNDRVILKVVTPLRELSH